MEFIMYPTTVKLLAVEIKSVCDEYLSRKISEEHLKKLVFHYAGSCPEMLFNGSVLNPTIINRIGKKRSNLLNKILAGYQLSL